MLLPADLRRDSDDDLILYNITSKQKALATELGLLEQYDSPQTIAKLFTLTT